MKRKYHAPMIDQGKYWSAKPARRVKKNEFVEKSLQYLKSETHILDLGCGRGVDALELAKSGCIVTALDISEANVEHMRVVSKDQKNMAVLQHDLAERLPFDSEHFDAVYAHLSLHYFDDAKTKEIFTDIVRVLKSGGHLFIKCKSIHDPHYGKGEMVAKDMYMDEHLRHFFSKDYMRECLSDFKVLSLEETKSTYADEESAFIEAVAQKA